MTTSNKDLGIAMVMLQHLNEHRLPHALKLKDSVDNGALLTDYDREFLKEAAEEARLIPPLLERQPQYKPLAYQEDIKTGESLSAFINGEAAKWKKVIVENDIKVE